MKRDLARLRAALDAIDAVYARVPHTSDNAQAADEAERGIRTLLAAAEAVTR